MSVGFAFCGVGAKWRDERRAEECVRGGTKAVFAGSDDWIYAVGEL